MSEVVQLAGRSRKDAHPLEALSSGERQRGRHDDRSKAADLLDLTLAQPALAADRHDPRDPAERRPFKRRHEVVDVAELPVRVAVAQRQQPRRLEQPREQAVADRPDDGRRSYDGHGGAVTVATELFDAALDLHPVADESRVCLCAHRGVLRQRHRAPGHRAVDHRTSHDHDSLDAGGLRGVEDYLGPAHVDRPSLLGGNVAVAVGREVYERADTLEPARQRGVAHVRDTPGHIGRRTAGGVDADQLRYVATGGQPVEQQGAEVAARAGDGDRRRRAAPSANALGRTGHVFIFAVYRGWMSELPFGFAGGASGGEGGDVPDLGAMLRQLGDLMSGQTGPINWNLAKQSALTVIGADAGTTAADTATVAEAVRLADLWLDPVTAMSSGVKSSEAWSRRRWLEATQPAWPQLVEPIAGRVAASMGEAIPEEMRAMAGPLMGVMQQVGGLMFGSQLGQALGSLAKEVVSSTDIGLPLGPTGVAALLPEGVAAFGEGLEVPADDVRLFLALREAAHHRLFAHVPWLAPRLTGLVRGYAQGIAIDTPQLEEKSRDGDPSDPSSLQQALTEGLFQPAPTPEQQAALARLETLLALVEGWVDTVTLAAATPTLPSVAPLNETMRRRRATGGPAEQTFATLAGLELRPRRLRDAAALWALLEHRRGVAGRDAVWEHPDLMPSTEDLDDPFAFVEREQGPDVDISSLES